MPSIAFSSACLQLTFQGFQQWNIWNVSCPKFTFPLFQQYFSIYFTSQHSHTFYDGNAFPRPLIELNLMWENVVSTLLVKYWKKGNTDLKHKAFVLITTKVFQLAKPEHVFYTHNRLRPHPLQKKWQRRSFWQMPLTKTSSVLRRYCSGPLGGKKSPHRGDIGAGLPGQQNVRQVLFVSALVSFNQ